MKLNQPFLLRTGLLAATLALVIGSSLMALAQKEWIVHSFDSQFGVQGEFPTGTLVADAAGNRYGTTQLGGSATSGLVYELVRPVPPKTAWTYTVLYNFSGPPDGLFPEAGLIFDNAGNLYGTTAGGGTANAGTVFELVPPLSPGGTWTESLLHSFTPDSGDGSNPETELTWDRSGNLIGVTLAGGINSGSPCEGFGDCGTVFELSPPSTPGGAWTETILHNFNLAEGADPSGTPVVAADGVLYGTTDNGGPRRRGVVYMLHPPLVKTGGWTYHVLHNFHPAVGSVEGSSPQGALKLRGIGVLYGTTLVGGAYRSGTVFQLVPPVVAGGTWTENVLYSFGSATGDGKYPANLIFDPAGNIYGTTEDPGNFYNGVRFCVGGCTVFQLAPPTSSGGSWTETVLYNFGIGGSIGAPSGGLILGKNGVLFGVTMGGGILDHGLVYGVTK